MTGPSHLGKKENTLEEDFEFKQPSSLCCDIIAVQKDVAPEWLLLSQQDSSEDILLQSRQPISIMFGTL